MEKKEDYFNSRPRVGATQTRGVDYIHQVDFNSRPRVGATCPGNRCAPWTRYFNSRPRVGATGLSAKLRPVDGDFNSRPRVGATERIACRRAQLGISIHAPAWGRRWRRRPPSPPKWYFNSRPRVGATAILHKKEYCIYKKWRKNYKRFRPIGSTQDNPCFFSYYLIGFTCANLLEHSVWDRSAQTSSQQKRFSGLYEPSSSHAVDLALVMVP